MKTTIRENAMHSFNLYQVQDPDRPMFVVAPDYPAALEAWEAVIRDENDGEVGGPPNGIHFVCPADELLLPWTNEEEMTDRPPEDQ